MRTTTLFPVARKSLTRVRMLALTLALAGLLAIPEVVRAQGTAPPGTPTGPAPNEVRLIPPQDPADTTVTPLGFPVVPGDTVLLEILSGDPNDPANWSDLVQFRNDPGTGIGVATLLSDLEFGLAGFPLDPNHVFIAESATSDFTPYVVPGVTYQIPSDPREVVPEPASLTLFVIGGLGLTACVWRRRAG